MRYLVAAVLLTTCTSIARADHAAIALSCDYHLAVQDVSECLRSERYTSPYTLRYVDRLVGSACDLHAAIQRNPTCPTLLGKLENLCALHSRTDSLLRSSCRSRRHLAGAWQDADRLLEGLRCALQPQPVVARRVIINQPAPVVRYPQPNRGWNVELNYEGRSVTPLAAVPLPAPRRHHTQVAPSTTRYQLDRDRAAYQQWNRQQLSTRDSRHDIHRNVVSTLLSGLLN